MCAQIKCFLAEDYSYTINLLPYNKLVQQLIYVSDSKIDEEEIIKSVPQNATMWTLHLASEMA